MISAAQTAVEAGQLGCLKELLNAAKQADMDVTIANHMDDTKSTPLHVAARHGDVRCLTLLLEVRDRSVAGFNAACCESLALRHFIRTTIHDSWRCAALHRSTTLTPQSSTLSVGTLCMLPARVFGPGKP